MTLRTLRTLSHGLSSSRAPARVLVPSCSRNVGFGALLGAGTMIRPHRHARLVLGAGDQQAPDARTARLPCPERDVIAMSLMRSERPSVQSEHPKHRCAALATNTRVSSRGSRRDRPVRTRQAWTDTELGEEIRARRIILDDGVTNGDNGLTRLDTAFAFTAATPDPLRTRVVRSLVALELAKDLANGGAWLEARRGPQRPQRNVTHASLAGVVRHPGSGPLRPAAHEPRSRPRGSQVSRANAVRYPS